MEDSYPEIEFDVFPDDDTEKFSAAVNMKLVKLGPIALFGESELSSSSGKEIEKIDHAHLVCSMKK